MNVACNQHDENSPILFVDFNQDFTFIGVGTKYGYSLLSTTGDQITETFSTTGDPICMVGRLFDRSLVILVSQNDMRKLLVFHSRFNKLICHYRYTLTILSVKMNRQRLVVCVEDGIFVHNIRDMQLLHKVEETPPNRNGVIALSSSENCYLAYPGSHRVGTVYIFDALNFQNVTSIAAHDGLLAALAFNSQGNLLATASEKGTVIRVFVIPQGDKVVEFRRGLARSACICSLTFSLNNQYLVVASHTETVHVFKLETRGGVAGREKSVGAEIAHGRTRSSSTGSGASQPGSSAPLDDDDHIPPTAGGGLAEDYNCSPGDVASPLGLGGTASSHVSGDTSSGVASWSSGLMGWMGNTLKAYTAYLPHQVSEIFAQDRAFAFAHLPGCTVPTGLSLIRGSATGSSSVSSPTNPEQAGSFSSTGLQPAMGLRKVAAVVYYQNQPRLIVAGLDGLLHIFGIDPVHGGEAILIRTQRLLIPASGSCFSFSSNPTTTTGCMGEVMDSDDRSSPDIVAANRTRTVIGGIQPPGVYVTPGSSAAGRASFAAVVASGGGADSNLSSQLAPNDVCSNQHVLLAEASTPPSAENEFPPLSRYE